MEDENKKPEKTNRPDVVPETTPEVTPEESDLSGGEQNNRPVPG